METKLLILGKGDSIITMILDNLYSIGRRTPDIHIYNNLGLPIVNTFAHDGFNIELFDDVDLNNFDKIVLGVYHPQLKN